MKWFASVVFLLVAAAGLSFGQFDPYGGECKNGRCPTPFKAPVAAAPQVVCEQYETDPPTLWRFRLGSQAVGTLDEATGLFESAEGKRWQFSLPAKPVGQVVAEQPAPVPLASKVPPPGGIEADKISPDGVGGFWCNGAKCDKRTAFQSLLGGSSASGLPDDSGLLRLTVIGPEADRRKVTEDIRTNATLANLRASVLVTDYDPGHWAVSGLGYKVDGTPTIYIQSPGGKVLHRQDEYDGPERLAGAIRKAKNYDPAKDKDLRNEPEPKPTPTPAPVDPAPTPAPAGPIKIPENGLLLLVGFVIAWAWEKFIRKPPAA